MIKRIVIGQLTKRFEPIKKVGLDSDVILCWISEEYKDYQPRITQGNSLFINYKVFSELMGILSKGIYDDNTKGTIFAFLRKNNITLIKKEELSEENRRRINEIYSELKEQNFGGYLKEEFDYGP